MSLWVIRILFLGLCTGGGYAISQVRSEFIVSPYAGLWGMVIGFGFGWLGMVFDPEESVNPPDDSPPGPDKPERRPFLKIVK